MITEVFKATLKFRGKRESQQLRRFVEITGKDLPKFAEVLRKQAEDASAKGDNYNALRLQNLARRVERAKKFTVEMKDADRTAKPVSTS